MRTPAVVTVLGLGLSLAACGTRADDRGGSAPAAEPDTLVLRVAYTGGFVVPTATVSRLPLVSVYADGRVITEGPVAAVYPGPAWPNVQVAEVDEETVQEYLAAARDAGVAETADLGTPDVADAPTTRFTLATGGETIVRDVYALGVDGVGAGYTAEQQAARDALSGLVDELTALDRPTTSYEPTAVAVLAGSSVEPDDGLDDGLDEGLDDRPAVDWPGPPLPGEQIAPGVGCVLATGEQADTVTTAARAADVRTPWADGDATWSLVFRPLLPDETGCADLIG